MDCLSEYISRVLTDQSWCARATKRHAQVVQLLLYLTPAAFYVLCMYVMLANMKRNCRVTDFLPLLSILGQAARCLWMILGSKPRGSPMWADVWGVNFHFGDGQGSQLSNVKLRFNWFNGFDSQLFLSDSCPAVWTPYSPVFQRLCVTFPATSRLRSCQETHGWITPGDQAAGGETCHILSQWPMRHLGEFWKESLWLTMIWQMWVDVANFVRKKWCFVTYFQLPFCFGYSFFSAGWKGTCQHTKSRHDQFCAPSGTLTLSHIIEHDIRTHDSISFMCFWFPRNPNRHLKYQNEVVFLGSCKTFDCEAVLLTSFNHLVGSLNWCSTRHGGLHKKPIIVRNRVVALPLDMRRRKF